MSKKILMMSLFFMLGMGVSSCSSNNDKDEKNISNIVLENKLGEKVKLSDFKGHNLFIKFWASWCSVCLSTLPETEELTLEKDKNFDVITVVAPGIDGEKSKQKFEDWYAKTPYKNINVLYDTTGEFLDLVNVKAYPTSLIVNKDLEIEEVILGAIHKNKIKEFFKDK